MALRYRELLAVATAVPLVLVTACSGGGNAGSVSTPGLSGDTFLFTSYLSTHSPGWNSEIGYGTRVAWPGASKQGSS